MIDATPMTALAICDICGRRELLATRASARTWLAGHESRCSPGSRRYKDAERIAEKRRNRR